MWVTAIIVIIVLIAMGMRIVQQYERGVVFRLGRVVGEKGAGLRLIIPLVDQLRKVNMRIITLAINTMSARGQDPEVYRNTTPLMMVSESTDPSVVELSTGSTLLG